ncbi:autotransporter domain-containing protein [Methylobacterium sp. J-076]|uniref:autotransporter domain-containing protein n=1 Tax=Methylobacterium sp. J-076 TaxID=2836655 RepID=UPI001FBB2B92|nr:autotransporter domain-containing protein [Methylobacterium sp. J-076]MCJ2014973.1 autotransporter domain-containing protein [Methylobacterium sp. J-076]
MISSGIGGLRRSLLAGVPAWAAFLSGAHAACAPATPASGQTVTCTGTSAAFIAPTGVTGLTVAITPDATVAAAQTSAGTNPSFTNVRVNGSSTVTNAGTIANTAPLNRDNFGVNLAGDRSTLTNSGTITLTAPAGNATTRIYGAYSSAPNGSQYASTAVNNSGTISLTQNGNGIARGIYSGENTTLFTINNSGLIAATRGSTATASTSAVAAVDSDDDTDRLVVNNGTTGRITAGGANSRALSGRAAQYEITNSGVIGNTTAGEAAIATFALNAGNAGDATTPRAYATVITNTATGVINGDVRNTDQDLQTAATAVNLRRSGTLTNAGTINGNLAFGGGNQTITNTGTIRGGITFLDVAATVNTVTLGTGSSVGGAIAARGLGTNTLTLSGTGTFAGTLSGFTSLTQTGAGSAWTLGPNAAVALSGNLTVAGGNLTLAAGSRQSVGGLIQVTGSGAQLTNDTALTKTVNLSGSNTTLVNAGTITGTGAAGRANTSANRVYGVIANSTGADFANVAVVNTGTIAVTENGIGVSRGVYAGENIASMSITNVGTLSATRAAGTTGTAAVAAVDSDDDVAALTVTNQAGGRIAATGTNARAIQGRAQRYTITNAGTIGASSGAQAIVVYGAGTAFLTNTGTITGDVRFTDADPQNATTANRRNSTTVNAGLIDGNLSYGMGNHTLTNTGQITGAITFADVAASRNSVTLGTGSVVGGPITATGRGRNALTLTGTGTLASNVTGFTTLTETDGAWTLASGTTQSFSGGATVAGGTLTVNAALTAATQVASGAALAGTGTVVGAVANAGTVAPGSATSPYGTLTVAGPYTQGPGGTLRVAVAPNANAQLAVTGAAQLDGALVLSAAAGTYAPGTAYRIVSAGSTTGAFTAVSTTGLPTLLGAAVTSDGGATTVTLAQQSFALVARTGNALAVARGVDAVLAGDTAALTLLDNRGDAQNAAFLDRVAGQGYASLADPELRSGRAFGNQLMARAYAAGGETGATGFVLPPAVYAADLPGHRPAPEPRFVEVSRGYGVWATGYGQFGHVDSTANAAGRSETVAGMAAGIDMHPSVNTVVGVAVGYGSVDVALRRTGERAHTDNAQVGVYGGYTDGAFYANGALGYARAEGRVNRAIGLPQVQPGGAQGDVGGDQFIAAGELGYRIPVATATQVVPLVGYQVNTFSQDRVRETGGGPFDLTVAGKDFLSARTLVGGRLETATAVAGTPVSLWVKAAYVHDFADVNRTISASFTLAPTVPFPVTGRRLDRDRALVTAGVGVEFAPRLQGFVAYDAELASTDTIQAVRGGVRYAF